MSIEAGGREADAIGRLGNLKKRVVSGAVLGCLGLGALLAGSWPFAVMVVLVALVMCWEWGKVVRSGGGHDVSFLVHAGAVSAAVLATMAMDLWAALGLLAAGAVVLGIINIMRAPGVSVLGVLYVGLPAMALVSLRQEDPYGVLAVLFILLVVSSGDIAAFAGGKTIGGPKLYPSISPNKTWAGLVSAVVAGMAVGLVYAGFLAPKPYAHLGGMGALLGLVGQVGDLAESALKRLFRVKDTSDLLPGHGGFMDRMDGLVVAAIVAALVGFSIDASSPARAIILGD